MATDTEQLVLQLSADLRQFEKSMVKAAGEADRAALRVERRFQQMNKQVVRDFQQFEGQVRNVLAAIGLGLVVRDVTELADKWTRVGNALAFAGVESDQLGTAQQIVADIASRTRSDLEATADLFSRMLRASEDLGASMSDVAAATEITSMALAGASQSERGGAIRQLGQGLASGRLQGDELRSILENSRPISEAIAAEFETTVGNLRELGKQGQLESRRVFQAILTAGPEIEAAYARTTFTVADAFTRLQTEAARFVGTNEQTSASVRGLTALIDFTAENFQMLADATIIAATVLGGTFAGVAVTRAVIALTTLVGAAGNATKALAFFGGPIGLAIAALGGTLAYVATQTDLLTSSTQALENASNSSSNALQRMVSLAEDLESLAGAAEGAADETGEIGRVAADAQDALDRLSGSSADVSEQLSIQGRLSLALAETERARTLDTLRGAVADQVAARAAIERGVAMRSLVQAMAAAAGLGAPERGPRPEEAAALAESERLQRIFEEALQAGESIDLETWQRLFDIRNQVTETGAQDAATQAGARANLARQAELTLARLRHDEARVRALQDAEELERRTKAYSEAGLAAAEARATAEAEITAERAAMNAEAQRSYDLSLLQDAADTARIRVQVGLAEALQDQLEIRRRTRELVDQLALSEAEALSRATAAVQAMRDARNEERDRALETRSIELAGDVARARGDERAIRDIERRLELEARIAELRRLGLEGDVAVDRAEAEVAALEQADLQGKFRDWFTGGVTAALDGDLNDFFENWMRERTAAGLEAALNDVADVIFEAFRGVLSSVISSGSEGLGQAVAGVFAGGASAGIGNLTKGAEDASKALGTVLTASAADAATKLALSGAASAAAAAKEAASSTTKATVGSALLASQIVLTKSAYAAAAALQAIAAGGGGSEDGAIAKTLLSAFMSYGGARANGGPVSPGKWYNVGEFGPERFMPTVPGVVMPDGGGGRAISVQYVDRRTVHFQGTGQELSELRTWMADDMRSRRGQVVAIVQDAIVRREL